jgi:hypothetical protein
MEIIRYVLVDKNDQEADYEYEIYSEALLEAGKKDCAIVRRTYTYDDSELVWTPNNSATWPPNPKGSWYTKRQK